MMKKKTLATLLTLTMLTTAAVPVFAADENVTTDGGEKKTTVSYEVGSTFTVVIPATVTLTNGTNTGDSGKISVSDAIIPEGKNLTVTITDATNYDTTGNKFRLVDSANPNNYLDYTIKNGEAAVTKGTAFLSVPAGTATGDAALTYTAKANKAGTYTDQLTFTAKVE